MIKQRGFVKQKPISLVFRAKHRNFVLRHYLKWRQIYSYHPMKNVIVVAFLAFFVSGCSDPEPAPKSVDFYVRYLADENRTNAEAIWYEGEGLQKKQITILGPMYYQNLEMAVFNANGQRFRENTTGTYQPNHIFSWMGKDGQKESFTMEMPAIENFSFSDSVLVRNKPANFTWKGNALGSGEILVFLWEKIPAGSGTVSWELLVSGGLPKIDLPSAKISELSPGRWSYYLVRKKLTKAQTNKTASSGVIEYYSSTDTILVQ